MHRSFGRSAVLALVILAAPAALAEDTPAELARSFEATLLTVLRGTTAGELPADQQTALEACSMNAFSDLPDLQKRAIVDAGVEGADQYLDELNTAGAHPAVFEAAIRCFAMLEEGTLVGAPEAQPKTP